MTIHLPEDLANSIRTEVLTGHFASEDEMVAAVVQDYLRQRQERTPPQPGTGSIGAMRDDAELLDQVTQSIMQARPDTDLKGPAG